MNTYKRRRFPPDIISHTVWLYHRFNLSNRDIEDLLAERGITVSYETIRPWCNLVLDTPVDSNGDIVVMAINFVGAEHYRNLRISAFNDWEVAVA